MLNILYFASLKESLQKEKEELPPQSASTVAELLTLLRERGPEWQSSLSTKNLLIAVNQAMANPSTAIKDGDEVAFFPPVTGG